MASDFIEDYYTYVEPLEVPSIFNLWCSLFTLSAVAQRKIWLDMGLFKIAPNLYVLLDADPGIGKDTAMNVPRDLLNEIPHVKTKSDSITKEAIFVAMAEAFTKAELKGHKLESIGHCSLTIFASELSLLIKKADKDFVPALCALYNCLSMFKHTTKTRNEDIIVCPYLAIIAGTTPDWIANNIQNDVMEGGFTARTIIVYSNDRSKVNPRPDITPEGALAYPRLVKRLDEISHISGEFKWSAEARKLYDDWYVPYRKSAPAAPSMKGFHTRKAVHLMKVMMLLSLSYKDELVIEAGDFHGALTILDQIEPAIQRALQGAGSNILSAKMDQIAEQIRAAPEGKMNLVELWTLNRHNLNRLQFEEVLRSLKEMNVLKTIVVAVEGKASEVYLEYIVKGKK